MAGQPGLHRDALDALGDANRRAIVELLSRGGQSVQEIADQLPISRPAVSRHLRLLKDAGLVTQPTPTARGTSTSCATRASRRSASYFAEVWDVAIRRFRIVAENSGPTRPSDRR